MIAVSRTVRTRKPVDVVSAFLSDFTTTAKWDPGTVETTQLDLGPVAVGTRFRNVSSFLGRRTTLDYIVRDLEAGRRIRLQGSNRTVDATDVMTFDGSDVGTTVTYRAELRFKGAIRYLEPVLRVPFNRLADKAAAGMQRELDALPWPAA